MDQPQYTPAEQQAIAARAYAQRAAWSRGEDPARAFIRPSCVGQRTGDPGIKVVFPRQRTS